MPELTDLVSGTRLMCVCWFRTITFDSRAAAFCETDHRVCKNTLSDTISFRGKGNQPFEPDYRPVFIVAVLLDKKKDLTYSFAIPQEIGGVSHFGAGQDERYKQALLEQRCQPCQR